MGSEEQSNEFKYSVIEQSWGPEVDSDIVSWIKSGYHDNSMRYDLGVTELVHTDKWNLHARIYPLERIANVALIGQGLDTTKYMSGNEWIQFALADAMYNALPLKISSFKRGKFHTTTQSFFHTYPSSISEYGIVLRKIISDTEKDIVCLGYTVPNIEDLRVFADNLHHGFTHRGEYSIAMRNALLRDEKIPTILDESGDSQPVLYTSDERPYIKWGSGSVLKKQGMKTPRSFQQLLSEDWKKMIKDFDLSKYTVESSYALFSDGYVLKKL